MNPSHFVSDPESEDQASLWAARLEGSVLSSADRAELDAWLAANPARKELLARFCRFSARLDQLLPELVTTGAIEVRYEQDLPRQAFGMWKLATTGLIAAGLVLGLVYLSGRTAKSETYSASTGHRQFLTLADGSRIELNANTSILVENGRSERRIRLANGEAFFEVAKDKARPFIVETPAGSVRVTGTKFNVRTEASSQLEVTVVEGSVQVRPGDSNGALASEPYGLEPGYRLSSKEGREVSIGVLAPGELEDALAWRQGFIVCNGMSVSDAIARFARYNGCSITASPAAAMKIVGGRYNLGKLEDFLDFLEHSMSLRVVRTANGDVHVSLPSEP